MPYQDTTAMVEQDIGVRVDATEAPVQTQRSRQNLASPVFNVPVDVLLEIFLIVRDSSGHALRGWFRVSHVCSHWREVAVAARSLWTYLHDTPHSFIPVMLERSRPAPLHITFYRLPSAALLSAIFQEIERIQAIALFTYDTPDSLDTIHSVLRNLGRDWESSILESLTVDTGLSSTNTLAMDVFRPTHRLRNLSLVSGGYRWNTFPFPGLTELVLLVRSLDVVPGTLFLETLRQMPNLQVLALFWPILHLSLYPPTPLPPPIHLPFLRTLKIEGQCDADIASFVSLLVHPQLQQLSVGCYPPPPMEALTQTVVSSTGRGNFSGLEFLRVDHRFVTLSAKPWLTALDEPYLRVIIPIDDNLELEGDGGMTIRFVLDILSKAKQLDRPDVFHLRHIYIHDNLHIRSIHEFYRLFSALRHLESIDVPEKMVLLLLEDVPDEDVSDEEVEQTFSLTLPNLRSITWRGEYQYATDIDSIPPISPSVFYKLSEFLCIYHARRSPIRKLELVACERLHSGQLQELQDSAVEVVIRDPIDVGY